MVVTIYHNPNCTSSRRTLALLRERGIEPKVVEYLKTPPAAAALDRILTLLGKEPRDLMRKREAPYEALGLGEPGKTRQDLIRAMVEHPILIERPVVVRDGRSAAIGRPPEQVLAIL